MFFIVFNYLRDFCLIILGYRGKARRSVPPLNSKCLKNFAESGERMCVFVERSALTLGSHVLSAYPAMCWTQREAGIDE